ncbi:hypothetical protein WUBG_02150 [Wuchereria bancrofti]|uniref:Oxidoreductase-like domain-containing protein n=1 Tax=Wuchereria bancrofti TaxID=6293 RepID=J9FHX0_WUCBA|nr:hypothetical protein WUBG_02150 [Wuchereria bancrofti]
MRRVFTVASKKDGRTPYFLCIRWRADVKADSNKELNLDDESGRMTTSSRIKIVTPEKGIHHLCAPEPPDPGACCASGCANCVWIEYVTELMRCCKDRPLHEVLDEVDRVVPDIGVRELVKAEVRARAKC